MSRSILHTIASCLSAIRNLEARPNPREFLDNVGTPWIDAHRNTIENLVSEYLPHGSGFDNGTEFDFERSNPNKLIFHTSYHHMSEHGMYDGWTDHTVTVTPDFVSGFNLKISGRDRNQTKDFIADEFRHALGIKGKLMARPKTQAEIAARLFIGSFPEGFVYADRKREKGGDYARLAFFAFRTGRLEFEPDCPTWAKETIERDAAKYPIGTVVQTSSSGQGRRVGT